MTKSDLRIKLTEDQKKTIAALKGENVSELARYYNVSRRTINFIQFPERKQASENARRVSGKSYYNKEKQVLANKKYLKRKSLLGN